MLTEMSGIAVFLLICGSVALVALAGAYVLVDALMSDEPTIKTREKKAAPDTFTCSHCGSGPWHNTWSPDFNPPLCPNCSGAD